VRRTILTLAAVLAAIAANAQQSIHPKNKVVDPEEGLPLYKRKYMPPADPIGDVPPGWSLLARTVPELAARPERIVITYGAGGSVDEHNWKFGAYRNAGVEVEIRGGCHSACTLITAYVGKDKLCFASGAFLAFHAVRTAAHETCRFQPVSCIGSSRRKSAVGSIAPAGGKTCRSTASGICAIANCGRWATRSASDPDLRPTPSALELVPGVHRPRGHLPTRQGRRTQFEKRAVIWVTLWAIIVIAALALIITVVAWFAIP
jgi:hypothetical protein